MRSLPAWGLLLAFGVGLAACDDNPFASKEKRDKKHSRDDDDDDDKPRTKGSSSASGGLFGGAASRAVTKGVTPVAVDLYVMSQCPYGVQVENNFRSVLEKLGPYLNFRVEYIGTDQNGQLSSMHGPDELQGDLAQICAQKHEPKFFDLILCQNKNMKEVGSNWEACADELGIDRKKIAACLSGPESQSLLGASFAKAQTAGARGSPTLVVAGQKHEGGRKPADLMQAICAKFSGTVPAECAEIPQAPKVNVTLLRDDRCTTCDLPKHEKALANKVSNPVISRLDYSTPEGKKLFDEIKPAKLPAFVFDSTLDADADAVAAFKRARDVAGRKIVEAGEWNPVCADAGGCTTDECKLELACRPEVQNKLEVFVMSQCPYAVKGLNAMKDVLDNFKRSGAKLDFSIHFIGDVDAATGELRSLHGAGEVQEDLREVCAISHYPNDFKFMNYILCRNKDIKSDAWESCTGGATGIEAKVIKDCALGEEGKRLLKASFAYSKASGMTASPSWLTNGKFKFAGLDAQLIKTEVCAHNTLGGCANTLPGPLR